MKCPKCQVENISDSQFCKIGYCDIDNLCQAVELAPLQGGIGGNAYTVSKPS